MKADIVLVKKGEFGIEDVIIIENKLSETTDYTLRQKEAWKKLANGKSLNVKYPVGKEPNGLKPKDIFSTDKIRIIKVNDHGQPNINNIDITDIQVNKWKDYKYKPNKQ